MSEALKLVFQAVSTKKRNDINFWVPESWVNFSKAEALERKNGLVRLEPYHYFKSKLSEIMAFYENPAGGSLSLSRMRALKRDGKPSNPFQAGEWLNYSNIYGLFIRSFSSFDHNQDGILGGESGDITLNQQGVRETGTFLKTIALLPYIKSLGFSVIYLEPFFSIGNFQKRGELGSPLAVRNPLHINPELHDTLIDDLDVLIEAKAFFEAAHALGLRVLIDMPSRAVAIDSDWIKEHPDWFYWISQDGGFSGAIKPPSAEEVQKGQNGCFARMKNRSAIVPDGSYFFGKNEEAVLYRDRTFLKVFMDESGQETDWLKIKSQKTGHENKPLWNALIETVRYYQDEYGIDGLWMSGRNELPERLVKKIRDNSLEIDPDFTVLSQDECCWKKLEKIGIQSFGHYLWDLSRPDIMSTIDKGKLKSLLTDLSYNTSPILGAPELRWTPRASLRMGGIKFSKAAWALICTLPSLIPFCNAGFEIGDRNPVDLGPDYRPEEFKSFLGRPLSGNDRLALDWNSTETAEMIDNMSKMNGFRNENLGLITRTKNIRFLETDVDGKTSFSPGNPVVSYIRFFQEEVFSMLPTGFFGEVLYPIEVENDYLIVVNMDFENERIVTIKLEEEGHFHNIFRREEYKTVSGELNLQLKPGDVIVAVSI